MALYLNAWSHCPNSIVFMLILKNQNSVRCDIQIHLEAHSWVREASPPEVWHGHFRGHFLQSITKHERETRTFKATAKPPWQAVPPGWNNPYLYLLITCFHRAAQDKLHHGRLRGALGGRPGKPVAGWWMGGLLGPLTGSRTPASEGAAPVFPPQLPSWSDGTVQTSKLGRLPGKGREHKGWRAEAQRRRAGVFAGRAPRAPADSTRTVQPGCQHRDSGGGDADFISSEMWCRAERRTG